MVIQHMFGQIDLLQYEYSDFYTDFTLLNCDLTCHVQWTADRNTRAVYWNNVLFNQNQISLVCWFKSNLRSVSFFSLSFPFFSSCFTLVSSVQMLWLKNSADSVRVIICLSSFMSVSHVFSCWLHETTCSMTSSCWIYFKWIVHLSLKLMGYWFDSVKTNHLLNQLKRFLTCLKHISIDSCGV